ncbi:MAG: thioester reductase domain-containing protein [Cyanobacteria bacterium P01_G01_bin.39]
MSVTNLIEQLKKLDVKLSLDGNDLSVDAPQGVLTKDLISKLKENKSAVIAYLKAQGRSPIMTIAKLQAKAVTAARSLPAKIVDDRNETGSSNILLTGVTGFLGTFLLRELLQQTEANIYCLTRAKDVNSARDRIKKNLQLYLLNDGIDWNRIIPVLGDLSQQDLGMTPEVYAHLAQNINAIYHNGALVHHATPYHLLESTNVLGTRLILQFACKQKIKPVHFISTISVFNFDSTSRTIVVKESDSIEKYHAPLGGYAQSKWVGERLVQIAGDRGLPITIHRIGPVSGSSETGVFNQSDFLYRLILGYAHLGSAPAGEMLLDILPVDFVAKTIVYISQQESSWGKAFHLIHKQPASSNLLFDRLDAAGYSIARVSYQKWYEQLISIANNFQDHILYPLVSLFSANNSGEAQNKSFNLKFDCHNVSEGLAKSSFDCPLINAKLIDTYISYLTEQNLLYISSKTISE